MKLYYNPILKHRSQNLRNNSTLGEILLWQHIKSRKMKGYQFMRQKPIDNYIVDFYCSKLQLVIEIDGETHLYDGAIEKDEMRQTKLESLGLYFLRFDDLEVKQDIEVVISKIEKWIEEFEAKNTISKF
jgi:very-short-patch-repair endonuclease